MDNQKYSDLLIRVYSGVMDYENWPGILDDLNDFLGGKGSVLLMQEHALEVEGFSLLSRFYREARQDKLRYYMEHYAHLEPWTDVAGYNVGETYFDTDAGLTGGQLDAQPHYAYSRDFLSIRRRIAFRLNDQRGWFDGIGVAFDKSIMQVPMEVTSLVTLVAPHLGRALELTRAFDLLKRRHEGTLAALDKFGLGVCIAIRSGEVIVANLEAQRILCESDALQRRSDGHIVCRSGSDTNRISRAINWAAGAAAGEDTSLETPIHLSGEDPDRGIIIDVTPLRDVNGDIERNRDCAVVFLIDLSCPPDLSAERFAKIFALTPAETEVLQAMAECRTTAEIAELRSTSFETARSQVKSILAKTRCANRGQLLRLMVRTLPPVLA